MEMTILLLLAEGLTNTQIANRMFFTDNTVRALCRSAHAQLGIDSPDQASDYAAYLRDV
ncbi:LuxR C-terminal-related transcriptional regulator [Hoyosella subflava]|uniref:HTH luxR-type domain-containing protein n=1 Tax=Hoyosella subflava (strain DSM 45089 / JCM 17490 / NBRC 109087 / DQS3-9A1) TaxID=443218 RepID=F6EP71_HOYSD|nr:LuxR C-terminal-related transcriptional regulator [Hoyosella subflava]AEF41731.1 hypothetical protein AS9A_3289 [Hoyosella subflava DQS3-9A1]